MCRESVLCVDVLCVKTFWGQNRKKLMSMWDPLLHTTNPEVNYIFYTKNAYTQGKMCLKRKGLRTGQPPCIDETTKTPSRRKRGRGHRAHGHMPPHPRCKRTLATTGNFCSTTLSFVTNSDFRMMEHQPKPTRIIPNTTLLRSVTSAVWRLSTAKAARFAWFLILSVVMKSSKASSILLLNLMPDNDALVRTNSTYCELRVGSTTSGNARMFSHTAVFETTSATPNNPATLRQLKMLGLQRAYRAPQAPILQSTAPYDGCGPKLTLNQMQSSY